MRFAKFCLLALAGLLILTLFVVLFGGSGHSRKTNYFSDIQETVRKSMSRNSEPNNREPDVLPRRIVLSEEEKTKIKLCIDTKDTVFAKSDSTFWIGDSRTIRWTSHKYLTNQSMILDVGGNIGVDAEEFIKRYHSRLVIFEPLLKRTSQLRAKFNGSSNVKILGLGLGPKDAEFLMMDEGENGEASSLYTGNNITDPAAENVTIKNTTEIFRQIGLGSHFVDLLHLDCEGCEIDVLEALVETNIVNNLKHIQFATHTQYKGVKSVGARYCRLQEILKRTHEPMYQYPFLWESWELKSTALIEVPG